MSSAVALYPRIRVYPPFSFHEAISLNTGKWSNDLLMYSFKTHAILVHHHTSQFTSNANVQR